MADENEPQPNPSQRHDDEETTDSADDDAQTAAEATQNSDDADSFDAETRMLQRIAALHDGDDDEPASGDEDDEPDAAQPDADPTQPTDPVDDKHATEQTTMMPPVAAPAGAGSGPTEPSEPANPHKRRRRWPWVLVAVVVLLGGGYVGAAYATEDTLPATLTVEDVDVSGMSVDEAAPVLDEALQSRAQREVTVTANGEEATFVPAESGFDYDVEATLEELTDLTFDPVEIWGRAFGEAHVAAQTTVDADAVGETVAGLSEQLTFEPTEGSVAYEGDTIDYSEPIDGFSVNDEELAQQLEAIWLEETQEIAAPGDPVAPSVSEEQWETFVAETAQPLIEDTYTVTADDATTELTPTQLGNAAEVRIEDTEDDGDVPVLALDDEQLTEDLAENNPDFESTHQDASVELSGAAGSANPEIVPGSSGRGVDGEQVVEEIQADLAAEHTRSISVDVQEVEPNITTEDAEAWDANHVVAEYATPYPASDEPRTANLEVGAERINGTVVMPEEEFNLDAILAPVTEANGYLSSGVVESGVTTNAVGGGLSQIATMAYNAGFLSGMEIVEHQPHSRWFDRYPPGRESTYWEGQINVRWANDTDAPVIVEMWLEDTQVHTRVWGSDYYDVSTTTSDPYNFTEAPTIHNSDDNCIAESGGDQGFSVDVHRTKTPPEGSATQESWSWAYSGWPTVICE